jgi:hypothetical protein
VSRMAKPTTNPPVQPKVGSGIGKRKVTGDVRTYETDTFQRAESRVDRRGTDVVEVV